MGASDEQAVAAERLQFTVGEGPCLQANARRQIVVAAADVIESRWPIFHDELIHRSPYRSVVSLPLQIAPRIPGALDLYFQDPTRAEMLDLRDAAAVAEQIGAVLSDCATPTLPQEWPDLPVPDWLHSPQAHRRLRTWIAAGILMAHFGASASNSLDRLRALAYARGQLLDDIADELIEGTLAAEEFAL